MLEVDDAHLQLGLQVLRCARHGAPMPAEHDGGLQLHEGAQRAHDVAHALVEARDLAAG